MHAEATPPAGLPTHSNAAKQHLLCQVSAEMLMNLQCEDFQCTLPHISQTERLFHTSAIIVKLILLRRTDLQLNVKLSSHELVPYEWKGLILYSRGVKL